MSHFRAVAVGIAVAAGPIAVLAHGFLGLGSIFTALILFLPPVFLAVVAPWRDITPNLCDGLFAALAFAVTLSFLINGVSDVKELALLGATFASYVTGRLAPVGDLRRGVFVIGLAVLVVAVPVTLTALAGQWFSSHGKPLVFGEFDGAPAQFTMLLGIVLLAAVTSDQMPRLAFVGLSVLAVLATLIFAASMVRFSLLAMEASLLVGAVLCEGAARRRGLTLVALLSVAIGVGMAARSGAASVYVHHLLTAAGIVATSPTARMLPPTRAGCPEIDVDNSLAIRKQLVADVVRLLPSAGLFGIGAGGFSERGCLAGYSPHNSFVEMAIDFGWLAGLIFGALVFMAWRSVTALAGMLSDYRFGACMIILVVLLSLVYGSLTHDFVFLLTLGLAAQLRGTRNEVAASWMLRGLVGPSPWRGPVA